MRGHDGGNRTRDLPHAVRTLDLLSYIMAARNLALARVGRRVN